MVRAASAAGWWLGLGRNNGPAPEWAETARDREACGDEAVLLGVINRYVENKKMVETVAAAHRHFRAGNPARRNLLTAPVCWE
jgi:hypothetical protein